MNELSTMVEGREIVVDEVLPHTPDQVWKTLTTPELMGRWLMTPTGFAPKKGTHFTYRTTPPPANGTGPFVARCWRRSRAGDWSTPGGRARIQHRIWRAAGYRRHLDADIHTMGGLASAWSIPASRCLGTTRPSAA
jgi:hypothetical protein